MDSYTLEQSFEETPLVTATDKRLSIQVEIGRFDPRLAKNAEHMVGLRGVVRTPFLRDRFQEGDNIFFVWEKLHTHCLDWMVREKANVDAKSILIVLKQLLCTFEMAHARNIFHGNIDETSIVVTANDAPWDHAMLVHWHIEMPDPDCSTTSLSLAKRDLCDLGETLQLLLRHCLEASVNARMGEKNEAELESCDEKIVPELKSCDEEDSAESEPEDLVLEDLFNEYFTQIDTTEEPNMIGYSRLRQVIHKYLPRHYHPEWSMWCDPDMREGHDTDPLFLNLCLPQGMSMVRSFTGPHQELRKELSSCVHLAIHTCRRLRELGRDAAQMHSEILRLTKDKCIDDSPVVDVRGRLSTLQYLYHMLVREVWAEQDEKSWWKVLHMMCAVGSQLDDWLGMWKENAKFWASKLGLHENGGIEVALLMEGLHI